MTFWALWFLAFGLADITSGTVVSTVDRLRSRAAVIVGALVVGLGLLACGFPVRPAGIGVAVGAALVWVWTTLRGKSARSVPHVEIAVLLFHPVGLLVTAAADPTARAADPYGLRAWLASRPVAREIGMTPEVLLLALGAALFMVATANALVRSLLASSGIRAEQREQQLRGGRLLGPLERLLILGFCVAGDLTGAALVASAKGFLRFPEISRDASKDHELVEYFLVGSMTSWLIALAVGSAVRLARM